MAPLTCPHCAALANFQHRTNWSVKVIGRGDVSFAVWECQACHKPIVGEVTTNDVGELIPVAGAFYPQHVPDPQYPSSLPDSITQDARAAHRCFAIGEWRASAAMARRALQGAAFDKEAPDKKLEEQIDWLEVQRLITPQMKEVAHRIRLGGNIGAHPDKDGLKDVGEPEALSLLTFLDDFIRYVYEIPERLSGLGPI